MPRTEPYTKEGVRLIKCCVKGCGNMGYASWNVCADNIGTMAQFRAVCKDCDIKINGIVMELMFGATVAAKKMAAYRRKVQGA